MKFKKSFVEKIIKEEILNHIKGLMEAEDDEKKEPEKQDASSANAEKEKAPKKTAAPDDEQPEDSELPDASAEEVPDEPDPADDELAKSRDDGEGDDDRGGGKVSDEIVGKRVQSVTMEPKSKVVPGAQELVITFDESPDPLRVLITKTGAVKFWYRGLHNTL